MNLKYERNPCLHCERTKIVFYLINMKFFLITMILCVAIIGFTIIARIEYKAYHMRYVIPIPITGVVDHRVIVETPIPTGK